MAWVPFQNLVHDMEAPTGFGFVNSVAEMVKTLKGMEAKVASQTKLPTALIGQQEVVLNDLTTKLPNHYYTHHPKAPAAYATGELTYEHKDANIPVPQPGEIITLYTHGDHTYAVEALVVNVEQTHHHLSGVHHVKVTWEEAPATTKHGLGQYKLPSNGFASGGTVPKYSDLVKQDQPIYSQQGHLLGDVHVGIDPAAGAAKFGDIAKAILSGPAMVDVWGPGFKSLGVDVEDVLPPEYTTSSALSDYMKTMLYPAEKPKPLAPWETKPTLPRYDFSTYFSPEAVQAAVGALLSEYPDTTIYVSEYVPEDVLLYVAGGDGLMHPKLAMKCLTHQEIGGHNITMMLATGGNGGKYTATICGIPVKEAPIHAAQLLQVDYLGTNHLGLHYRLQLVCGHILPDVTVTHAAASTMTYPMTDGKLKQIVMGYVPPECPMCEWESAMHEGYEDPALAALTVQGPAAGPKTHQKAA